MDDDLVEGFNRQRRNLMLMSVVVFFTQYVGLKFKTLSVFGNSADIDQPQKVYLFLWILLGYWLLRYTQYLHEIGFPYGWKDFFDKRNQLVERSEFKKKDADKNQALKSHLEKNQEETGELGDDWPYPTRNPKMHEVSDLRINQLIATSRGRNAVLSVEISTQYMYEWDGGTKLFNDLYVVEGRDIILHNLRAIVYVMVAKRFFTEYVLPYLLFMIAVGSAVDYHF